MIKIGLTGGIGSGKSTVSNMLVSKGIPVIDADSLSKEVLMKYPEILERVKIEFGAGFFDWKGEFRRREFGNHIFRFPKQRIKYENIIMPYIKKEIFEGLEKYEKNGEKIVILDAPTLIENDIQKDMDYVAVVWIDNNIQLQRLISRDKISKVEAVNRINSQMSTDKKLEFANIVINNNESLLSTKIQVGRFAEFLKVFS